MMCRAPVDWFTEIVRTAELVCPELLVPATLHEAVEGLTPEQLAVTPANPLAVKYFTRLASMCRSTAGLVVLWLRDGGGAIVPDPGAMVVAADVVVEAWIADVVGTAWIAAGAPPV